MTMRRWIIRTTLGSWVLVAGCDGSAPIEPAEPDLHDLTIEIHAGDDQLAAVESALPVPLAVRVSDDAGRPVASVVIDWSVDGSGGSIVEGPTSTTDAAGIATVGRKLGSLAGAHRTRASIHDAPDRSVMFNATGHVHGAVRIVRHPHDASPYHGTDTVLTPVQNPYRLLVLDHEDRPVAGVEVVWTVSDGFLSDTTTTTAHDGITQVTHTRGTRAGVQSAQAWVPGLVGSPVTFGAVATPGMPVRLEPERGDSQYGVVRTVLGSAYEVIVSDAYDNAVSGQAITWTVVSGGGSIDPSQSLTGVVDPISGRVQQSAIARYTLGSEEGPQVVTAQAAGLPGVATASFTAHAVTARVILAADTQGWCLWYGYGCETLFQPAIVTIPVDRTVLWVWGGMSHNLVFEDAPAEPVSAATKSSGRHLRTFTTPGTYRYRCTLHSTSFTQGMTGSVVVE